MSSVIYTVTDLLDPQRPVFLVWHAHAIGGRYTGQGNEIRRKDPPLGELMGIATNIEDAQQIAACE